MSAHSTRHAVEVMPVKPVLPIDAANGLALDYREARRIGESLSADYCFAEPFPHIVLDDFLPAAVARRALEHFPAGALRSDKVFEMGYAGLHKRQILPEDCDAEARALFHFFNSRPMLEFLEGLSTIDAPEAHSLSGSPSSAVKTSTSKSGGASGSATRGVSRTTPRLVVR